MFRLFFHSNCSDSPCHLKLFNKPIKTAKTDFVRNFFRESSFSRAFPSNEPSLAFTPRIQLLWRTGSQLVLVFPIVLIQSSEIS